MTTPLPPGYQPPDHSYEGFRSAMDQISPTTGAQYMAPGEHLGPQFGSAGLASQQMRINSMVPAQVRITGSPNGIGVGQFQRTMGGYMPPQNGISNRTYEFSQGLRLPVQNGEATDTFMNKRFFAKPNGGL